MDSDTQHGGAYTQDPATLSREEHYRVQRRELAKMTPIEAIDSANKLTETIFRYIAAGYEAVELDVVEDCYREWLDARYPAAPRRR